MDPEQLLMQIRQLLDQYLSLGAGTPVEGEAQALAAAIDSVGGGGAPTEDPAMAMAGGAPPPADMPMMGGEEMMPDMTGGMPLEDMQTQDFGSFADARSALEEDVKKKIKGR